MDPISQGALGAGAAQASAGRNCLPAIAVVGALGGMAPDLDVLIQSSADPLLFLDYHRQFTHSLIFIPVGALLVALICHPLARRWLSWQQSWLASFTGYATHGLLDSCTSYGTQLLWPFSDSRFAWNNVAVVDPAFTLPLLTLVIAGAWRRSRLLPLVGLGWAVAYLLLGAVQEHRARDAAAQLAASRGHEPERLTIKPSFANLLLFKSLYAHDGHYYVDAVHAGARTRWCPGERVPVLDAATHLPWLQPGSRQAEDLQRFRRFSAGYLAPGQRRGDVIDVRYSLVPDEARPLWGIFLAPDAAPNDHVQWWSRRDMPPAQRREFVALLRGEGCRPLPEMETP